MKEKQLQTQPDTKDVQDALDKQKAATRKLHGEVQDIIANRDARPVCPNCGQYQHDNLKGFMDCFHECAAKGFAPKVSVSQSKTCLCGFTGTPEGFAEHIENKKADYKDYGWSGIDAHHHEVEPGTNRRK